MSCQVGQRSLGAEPVAVARGWSARGCSVFEDDFLDCNCGFQPGRNPYHALQAVRRDLRLGRKQDCCEGEFRRQSPRRVTPFALEASFAGRLVERLVIDTQQLFPAWHLAASGA